MYEELISHLRECAKYDKSENTFKEAADVKAEIDKNIEEAREELYISFGLRGEYTE